MFEANDWVEADYRVAVGHLEAGRLADAEMLLRAVLAMAPNHAPAWFSLGLALMRAGKLADAADCFGNATALQPGAGSGWINLAHALMGLDRRDDAIAALSTAAELMPNLLAVQELLIHVYLLADKPAEALAAAERAIAIDPGAARVVHAKGCLHRQLMQLEDAASCLRRAVELQPEAADAWADLGTVLQAQLAFDDAKDAYRRALDLAPEHMLATLNLAQMLLNIGEIAESARLVGTMGEARDSSPDLLRITAEHARYEGRHADAIALYERALALRPDHAETLNGRGLAFQAVGRFQEAVDDFQRATAVAPHFAKAWANLAGVLSLTGQLDQVASFFHTAVTLDPRQATWLESLAWALFDLGRVSDALAALENAASLAPDDLALESRLLYCLPFDPGVDPRALTQRMKSWGKKVAGKKQLSRSPAPEDADRPLRIGYLLPNLLNHPIRPFIEPLLTAHDRARFAPIAYTTTPDSASLPPSLGGALEQWRFVAAAGAEDIAAQIRRDGIDVLVDVTGHRPGHRLDVLAERAAPVQLAWLVSTGLGTGFVGVDAVIGDDRLTPAELDKQFAEKVLRPFAAYGCWRAADAAPAPLPADATRPLTFGYVGRVARLNDAVITHWAAILAAHPEARLLIDHGSLRQPGPQAHLRARFVAHGIAAERIEAGFSAPVWSAWQRIDIALDPFPSSAGASIFEGLWMGIPSVSLAGALASGRFGAAILPHVGLADWVVDTPDAYVARAIAAARDRPALAELRRGLRDRLAASPLCDARGFAAALEATCLRLWREQRDAQ